MLDLDDITEVIGFDLGHGETALARLYISDPDKKSDPDLIEIFGQKNQVTAIGYHPTRGILIGKPAQENSGVTRLYATFKKKPDGDPVYEEIMLDYIQAIHGSLLDKIKNDTSFFIVGCPSAWIQDSTVVNAYEKFFTNAGIRKIKVVAESRAAYIHVDEKRNLSSLGGSVVVIDLGSSTTDITLLDKERSGIPFDAGRELGASAIDKAIFRWVLKNHPHRVEVEKIFNANPYTQRRCELRCREAKEEYFSFPENYREPGEYAPAKSTPVGDNFFFFPKIDGSTMDEILNTSFLELDSELKSWPAAFQGEMLKLKQQLALNKEAGVSRDLSSMVILLTGGASRMNFVQEICKQVFPNASVMLDDAPEFCIAKGLARWGRVEINSQQFSRDIEKFCSKYIKPAVAKQIDPLYDSIANVLADKVIKIIKKHFDCWKDRTHFTVDKMQSCIDEEIQFLTQEKNLGEIFKDQIQTILNKISRELRDDIKGLENKYGIPIGNLGNSFDLGRAEVRNLSLGNRPKIDPTDGITSGLSGVVGWIAGVLAAVLAWVIGPTVVSITTVILAIIIGVLGATVTGILLATPPGWIVLAAIGITVTVAGRSVLGFKKFVEEAVKDNLPSWDIPLWVRSSVDSNSVHSKINDQHSTIVSEISSKLKSDEKIRQELIDKITSIFEMSLKEKAEEMRVLIS
jgi:hypothetical protein